MMKSEQSEVRRLVVLGTGGTIAGRAASAGDNLGYTAGEVGVADLLAGIGAPSGVTLVAEQVAQLDSKDMSFDVWHQLAQRCMHWSNVPDVIGIVITHGTDTLEETAFFLHSVLPAEKPVALTCAMRPASALAPDGPQNVRDAIAVAATAGARGVTVVCAGTIHSAIDVQKVHTYRLDAFASGDAGPLGYVEEGAVRRVRDWPGAPDAKVGTAGLDAALKLKVISADVKWPRVEIIMSHAGATGAVIDALMAHGAEDAAGPVRGLILAATGNGTLHHAIEAAAARAHAAGIEIRRATRCVNGRILPRGDDTWPDAGGLSPVKARIALMLELMLASPPVSA
ncbi:asparaginase [Variovorax sp. RTB1]|uniref:asparaginase n=1 Tax=Variovorax sp. RTB1 TaxID=3048631 RepID=UPI002B23303F|nr:asparaginase [Variovorax sp. RTB1]MEB0111390.1 asparaginase [Variovorax sp. RTB1]